LSVEQVRRHYFYIFYFLPIANITEDTALQIRPGFLAHSVYTNAMTLITQSLSQTVL